MDRESWAPFEADQGEQGSNGYYTRDEFERIIDATYAYGNWKGGHDFEHRGQRLRALLLLMRWGGLAITDAVTLERARLTRDGKLFLFVLRQVLRSTCRCLRR
jgi:hypothetical protein